MTYFVHDGTSKPSGTRPMNVSLIAHNELIVELN